MTLLIVAVFLIGLILGYLLFRPVQGILYNLNRLKADKAMELLMNTPLPQSSVMNMEGKDWRPIDEKGKVLIIVFWSTTCDHCLEYLEILNNVYNKFKDRSDFSMVGIPRQQEINLVTKFCLQNGVAWPQAFETASLASESLADILKIRRIPSIWIIDTKGIIRGIQLPSDQLTYILRNLLDL
ncbi:MAG: TlpA family protein disulfide reductase [Spirochaetales bacterium]|nr:TlpA family protein disulfide reductase [Spirochaetales bacterium]